MKDEFDFNRIGKRMPYTTPEKFLDNIENSVWETIKDQMLPSKPKRNYRLGYSITGVLVAATIALFIIVNLMTDKKTVDDFEMFEQAFSKLSSADQDFLYTVYQDDFFIIE